MKKILILTFFFYYSIFMFSESYYTAFRGNLNVRKQPDASSKRISQIKEGHLVIVLERTNIQEKINNFDCGGLFVYTRSSICNSPVYELSINKSSGWHIGEHYTDKRIAERPF